MKPPRLRVRTVVVPLCQYGVVSLPSHAEYHPWTVRTHMYDSSACRRWAGVHITSPVRSFGMHRVIVPPPLGTHYIVVNTPFLLYPRRLASRALSKGGGARMGKGHPEAGQPYQQIVPGERRGGDSLLEFHRRGVGDDQHGTQVPVL